MHVMHVIGNFGLGGAEVGVARLANELSSLGWSQSICSLGNDKSAGDLLAENVNFFSLGIAGASHTVFLRLRGLLVRQHVDIVHVNNLAPWFDVVLAARLAGCRCVETFHGLENHALRFSVIRKKLFGLANRLSHRVTAVSAAAAELLADCTGINSSGIRVIENGIDTCFFAPPKSAAEKMELRQSLGLPADSLLLVCVAGLRPVKNHQGLLRAFAAVCQGGVLPIHLLLVGAGPLQGELKDLCGQLGIGAQVVFLGQRHDINRILAASDCFVLNSNTEGLSYSVLEAMACGLPVVVTEVGANPRLIESGVSGFLVPPGNEDILAAALVKVGGAFAGLPAMGQKARHKVIADYSLDKMVASYVQLYEDLAGENERYASNAGT